MSNCSNFGNGSLMFDISPGRDGNDIPTMSPKLIMHALCHIFNGVGLCLGESSNLPLFLFFFACTCCFFFTSVLLCVLKSFIYSCSLMEHCKMYKPLKEKSV